MSTLIQSSAQVQPPLAGPNLDKLPRLIPRKKSAQQQNTLPIQETPQLASPPDLASVKFSKPSRRLLSPRDHELFTASPSYTLILGFVFSLSDSVVDKKISDVSQHSFDHTIVSLLSILDDVEALVERHPATGQGTSRFGNAAFRDFVDGICASSQTWHGNRLGVGPDTAIEEISEYLHHSFGNRARLDYGSGHELNFLIWLLCLNRMSLLPPSTFAQITLIVLPRYIRLLRRIQGTYYLEPAGSHGVWGLDDYQFLPFLFGASQLLHHPYIRPLSVHNELILEEEGDDYIYLDMVRFTMASKTVKGLKWTQPMLDDISGAKNWGKVEQGMRRMFVKEVLGKLPVMQHFLFGSLVPAAAGMSHEDDLGLAPEGQEREGGEIAATENGVQHVHRGDGWGDCCGIKIPSTVAAGAEEERLRKGNALRRVPFD